MRLPNVAQDSDAHLQRLLVAAAHAIERCHWLRSKQTVEQVVMVERARLEFRQGALEPLTNPSYDGCTFFTPEAGLANFAQSVVFPIVPRKCESLHQLTARVDEFRRDAIRAFLIGV